MKKVTNLTWSGRLAVLHAFKPTDEVACKVLQVSQAELTTARDMEQAGTVQADSEIDTTQYASLFSVDSIESDKTKQPTLQKIASTGNKPTKKSTTSTSTQPQESATKPAPRKRGRSGTKIATAFAAIPYEPTPVAEFAQTHGVSVPVLRQSKRFDKEGTGVVHVKKDKATQVLNIWRDPPVEE